MKALLKKLHMILVAYGARSRSVACYKTENRFFQDIISVLKFYCKLLWKKTKNILLFGIRIWVNKWKWWKMIEFSQQLFHDQLMDFPLWQVLLRRYFTWNSCKMNSMNEFKCARRLRKQIHRHLSFSCVFSFQVYSWRFKLQFSGAQIFYFTFYFTLFICLVTEMWSDIFLYCFFFV